MRGQIPIIIALAIIMAIIISTALYLSTIPVNVKYSFAGKQYSDWEVYDHELTQLLIYMLREGGQKATTTAEDELTSIIFKQEYNYTRITAPIRVRVTVFTIFPLHFYYLYYWVNVTTGKEYVSIIPTYYSNTILSLISSDATKVLNTTALSILNNWINSMNKLGIRVVLDKFNAFYNLSLTSSGGTVIGTTLVSVNYTLTIFNQLGEYRVYTKTSLLYCQENFTHGYVLGKDNYSGGFILPATIRSYLVIDGTKYYYVLSSQNIKTYYYSPLFATLPVFATIYGGNPTVQAYIVNNGAAIFYRGKGLVNVSTIIRYTPYNSFLVNWLKYVHFLPIISLIKSPEVDRDNAYVIFNNMTWERNYYADLNVSYSRLIRNSVNITNIRGSNVLVDFSLYSSWLKVNYTKSITFYVPGYTVTQVNGIPVIIPTQFFIHYWGDYYSYDRYVASIDIRGT